MRRVKSLLVIFTFAIVAHPGFSDDKIITVNESRKAKFSHSTQAESSEFIKMTGHDLVLRENPNFAKDVAAGRLPPIKDRLPAEPLIIFPMQERGTHGGAIVGASNAYEVATSGMMSWRQVNLVRPSPDLATILPDVAKEFRWNTDRTELTFNLRKGHRWSDGAPFTSADVVFWMNDIVNNKVLHPVTPYPWDIGAQAKAKSDVEVTLVFAKPFPSALQYLTGLGMWHAAFAPRHFLAQYHLSYNPNAEKEARAAGFSSWNDRFFVYWNKWTDATTSREEGTKVPTLESHVMVSIAPELRVFRANPYFHKVDSGGAQLPYVLEHRERFLTNPVIVNEVLAGNIDIEELSLNLVDYPILFSGQKKGGYRVTLPVTWDAPVIIWNQTYPDPAQRKLFANIDFRRATSMALNREEINQVVYLGQGVARQALPVDNPFVTPQMQQAYIKQDTEEANRILDRLGLKRGSDGFRTLPDGSPFTVNWEFSLGHVGSAEFPALVAAQMRTIGIRFVLREVATQQVRESGSANRSQLNEAWRAPFMPTFVSRPVAMFPPFGDVFPLMGQPWVEWWDSKGASGQEPPAWAKRLFEISKIWPTLDPESKAFAQIAQEAIRIHADNLLIIGTVSGIKRPVAFSNNIGNTVDWKYSILDFGFATPYNPEQWFVRKVK